MKCHSDEGCCGGNFGGEKDNDESMFDNSLLGVSYASVLIYIKELAEQISDIIVDDDMLFLVKSMGTEAMNKAMDISVSLVNKARDIACGEKLTAGDKRVNYMIVAQSTNAIIEASNIFYENLHEINLEKL